jgi:hypothetical protein
MKLDSLTHWLGFMSVVTPFFLELDGLQMAGLQLLRFKNQWQSIKCAF